MMPCESTEDFSVFIIIYHILWRAIKSGKLALNQCFIYYYWSVPYSGKKNGKRFPNKEHNFSDNWTMKYFHFHLTNSSILPPLIFEVTENFDFSLVSFPKRSEAAECRAAAFSEKAQRWEGKTVSDCHQVGKYKTAACLYLVLFLCNSDSENMLVSSPSSTLTISCKFSTFA